MVLGAHGVYYIYISYTYIYIYIYFYIYIDPGSFFSEKTMSFRNDSFIPGKIYTYIYIYL